MEFQIQVFIKYQGVKTLVQGMDVKIVADMMGFSEEELSRL